MGLTQILNTAAAVQGASSNLTSDNDVQKIQGVAQTAGIGAKLVQQAAYQEAAKQAYQQAIAQGLSEEAAKQAAHNAGMEAAQEATIGGIKASTISNIVGVIGLGYGIYDIIEHGANPLNVGGVVASGLSWAGAGPWGLLALVPGAIWAIDKLGKGSEYIHIVDLELVKAKKLEDGRYLVVARKNNSDPGDPNDVGSVNWAFLFDPKDNKLYQLRNNGRPDREYDITDDGKLVEKVNIKEYWSGRTLRQETKEVKLDPANFEEFNLKAGSHLIISPWQLQAGIYNELVKNRDLEGPLVKPENFRLKEHEVKAQNFDERKFTNFQGDITETIPYQQHDQAPTVETNPQPLPPTGTQHITDGSQGPSQIQTVETQGNQAPPPPIATTPHQVQQAAQVTILTPTTGGTQQVATNNSLLDPREAVKDTNGANNLPDVLPRNTMQIALVDPRTPEGKKLQELFLGRLQGTLNTIEQQGLTQPISPLRVGDRTLVPKGEANYRSSQIANLLKPLNQLTLAASRVPWRYDTMALNQGLMYPNVEHEMQSDLSRQQFHQQQALHEPSDTQQIGQWLGIGGQALSIASGLNDLFGGNNNQGSLFSTIDYPVTFGDTGLYGEDALNQMSYDNTWQLNNWGW